MEKRYQVFVSSTYADLQEERKDVLQALMEMDCIPAGMELFPAADEDQWKFIKRVIDDCDYYLIIIGGRYGTTTEEGISYTEKEFDYAIESGLKVVALIHGSPDEIPFGKSEQDPKLREKLLEFKGKVMDGRLVKFWKTAEELPGLVALSLTKTIKAYPATGWIRANHAAKEEILGEINELRKENSKLQALNSELSQHVKSEISNIADFDSKYTIHGSYKTENRGYSPSKHAFEQELSWRELFAIISPYLRERPNEGSVKLKLAELLKIKSTGKDTGYSTTIDDQEFNTLALQLAAYGLIETRYTKTTKGEMALFWFLTSKGERTMVENRVIKNEG
jgi:hypothetical protein